MRKQHCLTISAWVRRQCERDPAEYCRVRCGCPSLPLVFSNSAPFLPVAITGLRTGTNAFLDADGKRWARGCYVPAYVRRYPFILMENTEQQQFILCVDEESGFLGEDGERRLFDDDAKPTEITNQALEFCRAYHAQFEATQNFVEELSERDLLTDNSTEIRLCR